MPKVVSAPWRFALFRGSNPCSPGTSISCGHPLLQLCNSRWHVLQNPAEMVCTNLLSWKVSGGQLTLKAFGGQAAVAGSGTGHRAAGHPVPCQGGNLGSHCWQGSCCVGKHRGLVNS